LNALIPNFLKKPIYDCHHLLCVLNVIPHELTDPFIFGLRDFLLQRANLFSKVTPPCCPVGEFFLLLFRHWPLDAGCASMKIDDYLIGMRQRLSLIDNPQRGAALQFSLPFNFVLDRRFKPSVRLCFVLSLSRRQHFSKEPLRAMLALRGIYGERPDDGLRHWHRDIARTIPDRDLSVCLVQDDLFKTLFMQRRALALRAFGPPPWIT